MIMLMMRKSIIKNNSNNNRNDKLNFEVKFLNLQVKTKVFKLFIIIFKIDNVCLLFVFCFISMSLLAWKLDAIIHIADIKIKKTSNNKTKKTECFCFVFWGRFKWKIYISLLFCRKIVMNIRVCLCVKINKKFSCLKFFLSFGVCLFFWLVGWCVMNAK